MDIKQLDTPGELSGAIRAHGHAWQEAYRDILPGDLLEGTSTEPTEALVQDWFDRVDGEEELFLIAVDDGGIARGYIYVRWGKHTKDFVGEDEAGLKEIYVHPDWWGQGIGTALLDEVIASLPSTIAALTLEMLAGNDVGEQFYRARGFDRTGTSAHHIDEESYPTTIYALSL